MVDSTFTFTHTNFRRLGGKRFVRKDANPHLTFPFHVARQCNTSGLDLTAGDTAEFHRFQAERPERDGTPLVCKPAVAAFVLLAIFLTFWL